MNPLRSTGLRCLGQPQSMSFVLMYHHLNQMFNQTIHSMPIAILPR